MLSSKPEQDVISQSQPLVQTRQENSVSRRISPDRLFDESVLFQFEIIPRGCRDENEWYGPWNTLLGRLFRTEDGFQIAPQHMIINNKEGPEWTMFYLIKSTRSRMVLCVIEVKPLYHYRVPVLRVDSHKQLSRRLQICITEKAMKEIPVIYGLSCIGNRFMVMKMDVATGLCDPPLNKDTLPTRRAPQLWWHHKANTRFGTEKLVQLAEDVHTLLLSYQPVPIMPVTLPDDIDSDEDDYDQADDPANSHVMHNALRVPSSPADVSRNNTLPINRLLKHNEEPTLESAQARVLQNAALPISRLPAEILYAIISLTGCPSKETPYPYILFSWVCHHWRLAIFNHATFWKVLIFHRIPPTILEDLLNRSHNHPLDIEIKEKTPAHAFAVIRDLPTAVRLRVKTLCILWFKSESFPADAFSDFMSFLPSLENIFFGDEYFRMTPIELIFDTSRIRSRLKAMQLSISSVGNLGVPGCFLELRWLRLTYEISLPLLSLVQALQNLPNLQVLQLLPFSLNGWRPAGITHHLTNRILLPELTELISRESPILHLIDAPKLSYFVNIAQCCPDSFTTGDNVDNYLRGFNFSNVTHIDICPGTRSVLGPYIATTKTSTSLDKVSYLSSHDFRICSIFDEPRVRHSPLFYLSLKGCGVPTFLLLAVACLRSALANLEEVKLNTIGNQPELQFFLNTLKGARTIRSLIIISGFGYSLKSVCDFLSDGDICPCLERFTYDFNCHKSPRCGALYIADSLRTLMVGRTATCFKPLEEVELRYFPLIQPDERAEIEKLGLRLFQTHIHQ